MELRRYCICPSEIWQVEELPRLYPLRGTFWRETVLKTNSWLPQLTVHHGLGHRVADVQQFLEYRHQCMASQNRRPTRNRDVLRTAPPASKALMSSRQRRKHPSNLASQQGGTLVFRVGQRVLLASCSCWPEDSGVRSFQSKLSRLTMALWTNALFQRGKAAHLSGKGSALPRFLLQLTENSPM